LIECSTHAGHSIAFFALCDPVTLTFDLILIGWRGLMTDYPCAKFRDFSFSRFGFIVWTNTRTQDRHIEPHTDATTCFTPMTIVGVSKLALHNFAFTLALDNYH